MSGLCPRAPQRGVLRGLPQAISEVAFQRPRVQRTTMAYNENLRR